MRVIYFNLDVTEIECVLAGKCWNILYKYPPRVTGPGSNINVSVKSYAVFSAIWLSCMSDQHHTGFELIYFTN